MIFIFPVQFATAKNVKFLMFNMKFLRLLLTFSTMRVAYKPKNGICDVCRLGSIVLPIPLEILFESITFFMTTFCCTISVAQQVIWVFLLTASWDEFPLKKHYPCTFYLMLQSIYTVILFFPCAIFNPFLGYTFLIFFANFHTFLL